MAPTFSLTDLNGETVQLENLRGRMVVLSFWATWCAPCRMEFAELRAWWERTKARVPDVVFLAINVGEPPDLVRAYAERERMPFRILLDPDGTVAARYNVRALPTLYIFDREGTVVRSVVGYRGGTGAMLDLALKPTVSPGGR